MNKTKILVAYSTNRNPQYQKQFNKHISKTIGCEHTIIPFENEGQFSLTNVYNYIWKTNEESDITHDEYVFVFIHHDIKFKTNGWGKNLLGIFNTNEINIVGVAGTDKFYANGAWWLDENNQFNQTDLWGKVWHTNGKTDWKTNFTTPNKKCDKIQPVVTIDGLFISFDPISCLKFDEDFDNFHFYDISFCLKNFVEGKKIAVTETIPICHESGGAMNQIWEDHRKKLIEKYIDKFPLKVK